SERSQRHSAARGNDSWHHQPRRSFSLPENRARQRSGPRYFRQGHRQRRQVGHRRHHYHRRRWFAENRLRAFAEGHEDRRRAQDYRQRFIRHPSHFRIRHRAAHRLRRFQQDPHHRSFASSRDGG